MSNVKASDLEYQGRIDGRHAWSLDGDWYYWTDKATAVTLDLAGQQVFCQLTLTLERGKENTVKAFTKADAKRAIVGKLNR